MTRKFMSKYAVSIIVTTIIMIVILFYLVSHNQNTARTTIANLDLRDITSIIGNSNYTMISNSTYFYNKTLTYLDGYKESSIAIFNYTGNNQTGNPSIITSELSLMSNSTVSSSALQSLLYSSNQNQSISGLVYTGGSVDNYSYGGHEVKLYVVKSVAVFNFTPDQVLNSTFYMPDYQYTILFAYDNYLGIVVVNSYDSSNTYEQDAVNISKALLGKLYSSQTSQ